MRLLQTQFRIVMAEVLDAGFVRFFAVFVQLLGDQERSARSVDEALAVLQRWIRRRLLYERLDGAARAEREDRSLAAGRRYDSAIPGVTP